MKIAPQLVEAIRELITNARTRVSRGVDLIQVHTNFEIGRRIVEEEQRGEDRAAYGKAILQTLAERLTAEFGRGFSFSNLAYMRSFYLTYRDRAPILQSMIGELGRQQATRSLPGAILQTAIGELSSPEPRSFTLGWTHYIFLLGIKNSEERASANEPLDLDPITGLPSQETAEATFQDLVRKPGKRFVVVAVVNRMQPINARFGHSVGNQVLRTFKEFFQHELGPQDRLFRWSGPALVAVLERTEALEIVRAEVRRMLNKPLENTTFDVGGREVLIPVSASWSVFMLIPPVTTANRQIQTFIASQGVRDYA